MRLIALLLLSALRLASAATEVDNDSNLRPVISAEEKRAGAQMHEMERTLDELQGLEAGPRRERELGLERPLEKLLAACVGTKHENKALYLLASWRAGYADYRGVGELLERLDRCSYPAYKQASQLLHVNLLLRQGQVAQAKQVAVAVVDRVPEFASILTLVAFHERVGQPAPRTAGRTMEGTLTDPATRPAPWLVYVFVENIAGETAERLGEWLRELSRKEYTGKVRLVCVTFAANGLSAATGFRALPGSEGTDLLWIDPAQGGEAAAWQQEWLLPTLPAVAVLGPDRRIVSVQARPGDLRGLVALPEAEKKKPDPGRGRNPWGK